MSIRAKAIESVFWVSIFSLSSQLLTFLTSIVLARLLVPEDFGLVAIAMLVINSLKIFYDLGLAQAFIYYRDDSNVIASTAFYLVILSSGLLYVILALISPYIASFFETIPITPVLRALALTVPISALGSIPATAMEKRLAFRKLAVPEISSLLTYTLLAILLANLNFGVWSIVWGRVAQSVVYTFILWLTTRWQPELTFDIYIARKMLTYGKDIVMTAILVFIFGYVDNAVIGKVLGIHALGIYTLAFSLANLPPILLTPLVSRTLFPALVKVQQSHKKLGPAYLEATKLVALIAIPSAFGLLILAPEIIQTVYTDKWQESIQVLRVLSVYGLFRSIGALSGNIFKTIGKQSIMPRIMAAQVTPALLLLYPIAQKAGVVGVASTMTLALSLSAMFSIHKTSKYINVSIQQLLRTLAPAFISAIIMAIVVIILSTRLPTTVISLLILCFSGALVYGMTVYLVTKGQVLRDLIELLHLLFNSLRQSYAA